LRGKYFASSGVMSEPALVPRVHRFVGIKHDDRVRIAACGGEVFTSFRQLIGRRELYYYYAGEPTPVTGNLAQTLLMALPDPVVMPGPTLTSGVAYYLPTLLSMLLGAFCHWRGTLRYTPVPIVNEAGTGEWAGGTLSITRTSRGAIFSASPAAVDAGVVVTGTGLGPWGAQYEQTGAGADMVLMTGGYGPHQALSVSVPFNAGAASGYNVVAPCQQRTDSRALSSGALLVLDQCVLESSSVPVKAYMSAGDDFAVYGWRGMTPLATTTGFPATTASW